MAKISQNLSTDSLFHFIKKSEWLLEILKHKSFQARYVYEDMPEADLKLGVAMKCFCDIPLGQIKKHMNSYGKFGIGITKQFAKKKYITPVLYFHSNSDTYYRYISMTDINDEFTLFPYFKADTRVIVDTSGKKTTQKFYDEREWRYVPGRAEVIDCSGLSDETIRRKLNEKNNELASTRSKFLIPFDFEDITYLFVQYDRDIDDVIRVIRKVKTTQTQQDRLIAKIITSRQIERDF